MKKMVLIGSELMSSDHSRRVVGLSRLARWLMGDFRITWHQMDWWSDAAFNAYLDAFGERESLNTHRKWALWQLLRLVAHVPGDTAECGVYKGASSWLICAANAASDAPRTHHLFDSFEGLSAPSALDGDHWKKGNLAVGEALVTRNLDRFAERIAFHKGWIPERFGDVAERRFSFVHVDVDLIEPTRDSVAFFYPRLSPGGILLCDDYAFTSCPGATIAVDEYLADKPEKMIGLPAGGGFLIKGQATSPVPPLPEPGPRE